MRRSDLSVGRADPSVRRFGLSVLLLLLSVGLSFAAPPKLKLPAEVRPVGEYATVQPETDAASVLYVGLSGYDPFPTALLKDPKTFLFPVRGLPAGRYKFAAVAAGATGEQSRVDFEVIVGNAPPPIPPGPGPGPGPNPPNPTDPLQAAFKAALDKETAATKVASAIALADLFNAASEQVKTATQTKVVDFYQGLHAAATTLIGKEIPAVREAITKHLDGVLPKSSTAPLDAAARELCSKTFLHVATSLRGCCP